MSGPPPLFTSDDLTYGAPLPTTTTATSTTALSSTPPFNYASINYDTVLFRFDFRINTSGGGITPAGFHQSSKGADDDEELKYHHHRQQSSTRGAAMTTAAPPPIPPIPAGMETSTTTTTSGGGGGGPSPIMSSSSYDGERTTPLSQPSSPITPLPPLPPHHFGLTYSKRGDHFLLRTPGYPKYQENQPPSTSFSSGDARAGGGEVIPARIALHPLAPAVSTVSEESSSRKEQENNDTKNRTKADSGVGDERAMRGDSPLPLEFGEDPKAQTRPDGTGRSGGGGGGDEVRYGWNITAIPKLMLRYFQSPMPRLIHIPWKIKLDKNEANPNLSVSLWFSMMTLQQAFEKAGIVQAGSSPLYSVDYSLVKDGKVKVQ